MSRDGGRIDTWAHCSLSKIAATLPMYCLDTPHVVSQDVMDAPAEGHSDVARQSAAEGVAACDTLHERTMTSSLPRPTPP